MMRPPTHPLIAYVAVVHGITPADMIGPLRRYADARAVAAFLLARQGQSGSAIARMLHKNPSSVNIALARVQSDTVLRDHAHECLYTLEQLAFSVGLAYVEHGRPVRRKKG